MTACERYKKAQKYFSGIEKDIVSDIEKSMFKKSLECLYKKTKIIELIKDGIISPGLNLYASQILHRSLIEHYLLSQYIFLRCKIDNSDAVGEEYYNQYSQSETLKQITYSLQLADIRNNIKRTIDISVLKQQYPFFENISQRDIEECHRMANQFSNVKIIGDYLLKNKDYESMLASVNQRTFDLLEKYSIFSSFIHGGPHAEKTIFEEVDLDFATTLEFNIEWAYTLAHISKANLVLLLRGEFYEKYKNHFTEMYK